MSQLQHASKAKPRTALVMAGGTGGHIFPGLAVAQALRAQGWGVHWMGAPGSMESRLIPEQQIPLHLVDFGGVRGKGLRTLLMLPWRLMRAFAQAFQVMRQVQPDVVIGMGGYITFPGGMMAALTRRPVIVHEQNSVAGLVNKLLARVAQRVFTAFPQALPQGEWIGNPLRESFLKQPQPDVRWQGRSGPLKLLVVGGSLGAKALNEVVPKALALMPADQRPRVLHQSGAKQLQELQRNYEQAGIEAELTAFIEDTATAYADADVVLCRAGASTVTELAAVGAPAIFVPFPFAVDDHQTVNAQWLVNEGAGWLVPQKELTPESLAHMLQNIERKALLQRAQKAKNMQKINATEMVVRACEELLA